MTYFRKTAALLVAVLFSSLSYGAESGANQTLKSLLADVEASIDQTQQTDQTRLNQFLADKNKQARLLTGAKQRLQNAEQNQERLKNLFDQNESRLVEQNELLKSRSGQLGEVFGVVKQQAQDLSGVLQDSLISTEYPDRLSKIAFADEKRIPTLAELQGLWFLLLQEMTATSEIKSFEAQVAQPNGVYVASNVQRVGPFVAIDEQGRFLKYDSVNQQLEVFARQPGGSVQSQAQAFYAGDTNRLVVDPSRGNLLELLGRTPTIQERIDQAGLIGYIILALGAFGLLVALWRLLAVFFAELKIKQQYKKLAELSDRNPLGRVLSAVNAADQLEQASSPQSGDSAKALANIEIRMDEALLKEVPRLEYGLTFLKLLAAVAPLLGLLGTVTGMIGTFQSITVFGTSDPKLMAGGISQALMTTVLGLCVAIPLLFTHSLIAARVRRLIQLLQQVAFASIADRLEDTAQAASDQLLKTQPTSSKPASSHSPVKAVENAV